MAPIDPVLDTLKAQLRSTWMAGDFGRIAEYATSGAQAFVDRLQIQAGTRVLDVACGTGNVTIPAAQCGAVVTGLDIAPNLLEQARLRANEAGVTVTWDEGDAEHLPYADESFDLVLSMFGAMFAPQPDRVATELFRVCRRGGRVVMANWNPQSFSGKLFAVSARHVPPPPGMLPPVLWGKEEVVRERLGPHASQLEVTLRPFPFRFPFPPQDVVEFFREYFGPTHVAFSQLDEAAQAAMARDLEKLWSDANVGAGGSTSIENEYLEVVAVRA